MTPVRVLFDTNVVLDALLERHPFFEDAAHLLDDVARKRITGLLCATTLTTVDYIVGRERGRKTARQVIRRLLELFEVASVGRLELDRAASSPFADFEDAVLHEAARSAAADSIVTRNAPDFTDATVPVYGPAQLRALLNP